VMFHITPNQAASHKPKKGKLTCLTCKLKGCVAQCRWEAVLSRESTKRKAA
jgi:hypothetical protein